jgi:hypothetical protein
MPLFVLHFSFHFLNCFYTSAWRCFFAFSHLHSILCDFFSKKKHHQDLFEEICNFFAIFQRWIVISCKFLIHPKFLSIWLLFSALSTGFVIREFSYWQRMSTINQSIVKKPHACSCVRANQRLSTTSVVGTSQVSLSHIIPILLYEALVQEYMTYWELKDVYITNIRALHEWSPFVSPSKWYIINGGAC